ncbi:NrfD/PsrC family molybdoenzyme membrane anchor subunit [Coralloluteibacterium stylophorae]|uniref:Polysulfide reductase NrfD n=1 Tax=Coralloluteibacterium stylophorae TaxID=1776034 RepID=A0A8J7VQN8_9GAMM|nr:NrfD/PsrC family molybdoenzyme membrane anchor subunit [Coralloluteibacterium stylophorae]MBS7456398.1 polysulfide reductase NrfD [Coralloluteibacterium stylophorae]
MSGPPEMPAIAPGHGLASIGDAVALRTFAQRGRGWWLLFGIASALALLFAVAVGRLLWSGPGVWGLGVPVAWGLAISNYVWWIGIGMAGTFISAALHLTDQPWRAALARYAESMTVFAVAVSGFFPILHLGRPWFFYWLFPYPDSLGVWPQWKSALVWDFLAILAYLIVSIIYWYVSLVPDVAVLRDRAPTQGARRFYGLLALGWQGSRRQWTAHARFSGLLAALAVPLVFSVHSMVALDFSQATLPGWHSAIFPPFFVAGALYSGFAMALVLGIPLRAQLALGDFITPLHLDRLARILLAVGLFVNYAYLMEIFVPFYSRDEYEIHTVLTRMGGPYAPVYWSMLALNLLPVQLLWSARLRTQPKVLFGIGLAVVTGMWLERYMLVVTSLSEDYLPSSWGHYLPSFWDWALFAGSVGVFGVMFLLFVRWLPVLSVSELRGLVARRPDARTGASR